METSSEIDFFQTLVVFAGIVFLIAIGVILLNYQFRKNLHQQQLARRELKLKHQEELLRTSIEVQEKERKRIAQNLHDELGALLSMSRMQLIHIERHEKNTTAECGQKLAKTRMLIENALTSTRRISHELMPIELETLGLGKAIEAMSDRAKLTGFKSIKLDLPEEEVSIPWFVTLGLYRIYSELINNTLKHADASRIEISIKASETLLICSYADNGKGLPDDNSKTGLGLRGLEGRINALQASIKFNHRQDSGFSAIMEIPLFP